MAVYELKFDILAGRFDEFIDSLTWISTGIRKEEGCLGFTVCRNLESENSFRVLAEWKTRQAMEKHFQNDSFAVLIGATKVLGRDFEMSTSETLEKGNYQLAKDKISLQPEKGK